MVSVVILASMLLCATVALSADELPAATSLRPVSDQASVLPEGAFKRIGEPHWGHNGWTQLVAWRPDSNELASVGRDGYVRVWDVASRKELLNARFEGSARVLRYTADGEQLVLVVDGHPPRVIRWNADTGEIVAEKRLPELIGTRWKYFLVGSPQLQRLGMMCGSLVQVHDLETGDLLYELDMATLPNANRSSDGMVYARPMAFSPDGETLYVPVTDGFLRILPGEQRQLPQLKIGPLPQELRGYLSPSDLDVSPDGERLAACRDGWTMVCNLTENNPIQWLIDKFSCHDLTRFSPDSEMLIGGGHSGSVMLWEVPSGDMQDGYPLRHESLWDVAVSSNDERMALARSQNAIRLIDLASGEEETAELTPVFRRGLMFSSDGKTLVTAGERNRLFYWNVETCEELGQLTLPNEARHYLSFFSSDAQWLLSPKSDDESGQSYWRVYDLSSRSECRLFAEIDAAEVPQKLKAEDPVSKALLKGPASTFGFDLEHAVLIGCGVDSFGKLFSKRVWSLRTGELVCATVVPVENESLDNSLEDIATVFKRGLNALEARARVSLIGDASRAVLQRRGNYLVFQPPEVLVFNVEGMKLIETVESKYRFGSNLGIDRGLFQRSQLSLGMDEEESDLTRDYHGQMVDHVRDEPHHRLIIAIGKQGIHPPDRCQIIVFDTQTKSIVKHLDCGPVPIDAITLDPDGTTLASGHADGTVLLWDLSDEE